MEWKEDDICGIFLSGVQLHFLHNLNEFKEFVRPTLIGSNEINKYEDHMTKFGAGLGVIASSKWAFLSMKLPKLQNDWFVKVGRWIMFLSSISIPQNPTQPLPVVPQQQLNADPELDVEPVQVLARRRPQPMVTNGRRKIWLPSFVVSCIDLVSVLNWTPN